ncbi:MAG: hypothetical protein QUU85_17300, partial [Candidatus Eisenbacteria bacterium]|nr:hypothetical protein [Candidatus Eisenbacteria bacterium]
MSPRRIRLAMLSVFAIVFLFSALFLFRDYTKVRTLTGTSDIWSVVRFAPGGLAVLQSVEPSDFAGPFLPQDGDTLLTIGGQRATADTYFAFFNNRTAPGAVFPATFRHGDRILETTLIARLVPAGLRLQVVTLYLLRILLIVGLLGVGVWACVHRGTSAAVRSLALYCATTAVLLQVYQPILPAAYASFRLPWQPVLVALFGSFALLSPAFWLKLQLLFPTTNRLYERHRWIANAVLFLPAASIALLALLRRPEAGTARLLYDLGFLSAGFILLLIHYRRAASPLLRRQTRLVLWGSGPATVLSVSFAALWLLSPEALSGLSTVAGLYPVTLQFLLILVIPISFAIAFGRYGLLEVEGKVKRGTRFALSNALLLVLFVGVLYGFAKFLLASLRIDTQAPTLVLGIVLALAFAPSRRRLHEALESRIYP